MSKYLCPALGGINENDQDLCPPKRTPENLCCYSCDLSTPQSRCRSSRLSGRMLENCKNGIKLRRTSPFGLMGWSDRWLARILCSRSWL